MKKTKNKLTLNLIALLIFFLFIWLGIWQLHRAAEKRLLLNNFSTHIKMNYLGIKDIDRTKEEISKLRYYPIKIRGTYDNAHVFLLDNKFYNHQLGYEVLTPFFSKGGNKPILINRGWIFRNYANHQTPPTIPSVHGEQKIHGLVYIPLGKTFVLKKMSVLENIHWPLIMQALKIEDFEKQLKQSLYPAIIWLDKEEKNGFVRDWHPVVMLPQQHIAYAIQWFMLALTLLIIYISLNRKQK
jgi:surfeit locus 1 family protein